MNPVHKFIVSELNNIYSINYIYVRIICSMLCWERIKWDLTSSLGRPSVVFFRQQNRNILPVLEYCEVQMRKKQICSMCVYIHILHIISCNIICMILDIQLPKL